MPLQCCQLYYQYHFRSKIDKKKCPFDKTVIFISQKKIARVGNTVPYQSDKFVMYKYLELRDLLTPPLSSYLTMKKTRIFGLAIAKIMCPIFFCQTRAILQGNFSYQVLISCISRSVRKPTLTTFFGN